MIATIEIPRRIDYAVEDNRGIRLEYSYLIMRKQSITARAKLVKECDRLFSLVMRQRDGKCVTCGSVERLGAGHLFTRAAYSTRWDLENGGAQCWGCNFKHEYDPYPLTEYVRGILGQERYDALHLRYQTPHKFKNFELEEMIEELKKTLDTANAME